MMDYRSAVFFDAKFREGARPRKLGEHPRGSSVPYLRRKRRWNAAEAFTAQIGDAIASPEAPRSGSEAFVALAHR